MKFDFLGMDLQTINSFLTMRRIVANCRILMTTTRAVLNDPELSNFEKILYSVLYTDRIAEILSIK